MGMKPTQPLYRVEFMAWLGVHLTPTANGVFHDLPLNTKILKLDRLIFGLLDEYYLKYSNGFKSGQKYFWDKFG